MLSKDRKQYDAQARHDEARLLGARDYKYVVLWRDLGEISNNQWFLGTRMLYPLRLERRYRRPGKYQGYACLPFPLPLDFLI